MAESEEELKNLLKKGEKESKKSVLKFNIQKIKIMAFGAITSWQVEEEKVEAVILFSLAPKLLQTVTTVMKLKDTCTLEGKL